MTRMTRLLVRRRAPVQCDFLAIIIMCIAFSWGTAAEVVTYKNNESPPAYKQEYYYPLKDAAGHDRYLRGEKKEAGEAMFKPPKKVASPKDINTSKTTKTTVKVRGRTARKRISAGKIKKLKRRLKQNKKKFDAIGFLDYSFRYTDTKGVYVIEVIDRVGQNTVSLTMDILYKDLFRYLGMELTKFKVRYDKRRGYVKDADIIFKVEDGEGDTASTHIRYKVALLISPPRPPGWYGQHDFERANKKWISQRIENYSFTVRAVCSAAPIADAATAPTCENRVSLVTVANGKVVSPVVFEDGQMDTIYSLVAMSDMFEKISAGIRRSDGENAIDATYNNEWGYITSFQEWTQGENDFGAASEPIRTTAITNFTIYERNLFKGAR